MYRIPKKPDSRIPDIRLFGKAGYRISGWKDIRPDIRSKPDIWPDIQSSNFFLSILQLIIHLSIVLFTFFSFSPINFLVFQQKLVNWIEYSRYPVYPAPSIRPAGYPAGYQICYPAGYRILKKAGYPAWPDIRYIPRNYQYWTQCLLHKTHRTFKNAFSSNFSILRM